VICNDEDKTKDDLEGTVSFDLTQIPNRTLVDRYFPLVCPDKAEAEIRISIYLSKGGHEGVFGESTSLATMWKAKQSQSRGNLEVNHAHGLYEISAGMLKVSNHYDPPHGEWPARVMFTIHKGKNLLPMDGSGLSDPYVVVFQGREKRKDTTYKTSVKKQTLNPIWFVNNRFSFTIPNDLSPQDAIINFQVYDADVASDDKMGACILELKDCLVNWTRWLPISYVPTECEVMNGTSEGKRLRREGYVPNYPIFCIPGFASSALSCEESTESLWRGERVWLNLTGLVKGKCTGIASKFSEHMSLQEDCVSDPPGIKVRPNLEIEGCMYLETGTIGKKFAYVLGPLIQNLIELGYVVGQNLFAKPYDWRLPPHATEERDGYLTNLANSIQECSERNGKPVMLLGHSMGNKMIHYFLFWAEAKRGRAWIDKHIHTFIAVGAPWIGAPKMVRTLASGDREGLELLLSERQAIRMIRTVGSTMFLLPTGIEQYYTKNFECAGLPPIKSFVFFQKKNLVDGKPHLCGTKKKYESPEWEELWKEVGHPTMLSLYAKYFGDNPLYGKGDTNSTVLKCPPVKCIYNCYGVNVETEKLYFYKKKGDEYILDENCSAHVPYHTLKRGIAFETEETPQYFLRSHGRAQINRSGDGTVTYESLAFPNYHWDKTEGTEYKSAELPNCEHRNAPCTTVFFNLLIPHICTKLDSATVKKGLAMSHAGANRVSQSPARPTGSATPPARPSSLAGSGARPLTPHAHGLAGSGAPELSPRDRDISPGRPKSSYDSRPPVAVAVPVVAVDVKDTSAADTPRALDRKPGRLGLSMSAPRADLHQQDDS